MSEISWEETLLQVIKGDISRLTDVWRYSSIPTSFRENTVEHQGWVTIYAILIHQILRDQPQDLILLGPIATHASTHDLAESVTGDVVRTFKYSDPDLRTMIGRAEKKIIQDFPVSVQRAINSHITQLNTIGCIGELEYVEDVVKMADFLSLWMFMRREVRRGNKDMYKYFDLMIKDFKSMQDIMANKMINASTEKVIIVKKMVNFYHTLSDYDNPTTIT